MPATDRRWTRSEVWSIPDDGNRYELIDGRLLVTPSPNFAHQRGAAELWRILNDYVRREGVGEAAMSPADIELEPDTIVQPDVFVVPFESGARPKKWSDVTRLVLACEIVSPGSARHDRITKRRFFSRIGVPEYWIIDPEARIVERWRPGDSRPEIVDVALEWQPEGARSPLRIELGPLFQEAHGEVG